MKNLILLGPSWEAIAAKIREGGTWDVRHPVRTPRALLALLRGEPDDSIDRLDIVDHGGPGYIQLGDELLFASDEDPESPLINARLVTEFRDKLAETAQVRLLGCNTAGPGTDAGRLLLVKLAALLNPLDGPRTARIAYGTVNGVEPSDFDEDGLIPRAARTLLFSSDAAVEDRAESYDERLEDIAEVRAGLGGRPADE